MVLREFINVIVFSQEFYIGLIRVISKACAENVKVLTSQVEIIVVVQYKVEACYIRGLYPPSVDDVLVNRHYSQLVLYIWHGITIQDISQPFGILFC